MHVCHEARRRTRRRRVDAGSCSEVRLTQFALAAGEASGDTLGAGLIEALRAASARRRVRRHGGAEDDRGRLRAVVSRRGDRGHGLLRGAAALAAHSAAAPRAHRAHRARADADVFIGIDAQDFNRPVAAALKRAGHQDRAVREPAGLGVAAVACRDDPRRRRPRALRAAVRAEVLCSARRQREVRRPSARRHDSARGRQGGRARQARPAGATSPCSRCCPAAGAARSSRLAAPFMATAAWLKRERPDLDGRRRARERVDGRAVSRGDGRHGSRTARR